MGIVDKKEWYKLHIAKLDGWILSLAGDQHVLGWLIIFPPVKIEGSITALSDTEIVKFKQIATIAENLLKRTFNADWFNYTQAGNVLKNLHIHLQPRYSSDRIFENFTFRDEGWGHPVKYLPSESLPSKELVFQIVDTLKGNLKELNIQDVEVKVL
jgi:diadenosine tetraphosphate (Ap4A) HIT family hydrolase